MGRVRASFCCHRRPGPLVGPVLAAQFGYLPGTLWIISRRCLRRLCAGFRDSAVLRPPRWQIADRDGARGNWPRRRICGLCRGHQHHRDSAGGCALVVVNALKASPWGTFTIAMTIPIALLMGLYLRRLRPGQSAGNLRARLCAGDAGDLGRAVGFADSVDWRSWFTLTAPRWRS